MTDPTNALPMPYQSGRKGLMWEAAERGNIRLRNCEKKEYAKMRDFIQNNPGCTQEMLKTFMGTWRVGMLLAYGVSSGDIRGDLGKPEKWWLANEYKEIEGGGMA